MTIKNCPFCGGEAELTKKTYATLTGEKTYRVRCKTTYCIAKSFTRYFHTEEEAITAWNKRG